VDILPKVVRRLIAGVLLLGSSLVGGCVPADYYYGLDLYGLGYDYGYPDYNGYGYGPRYPYYYLPPYPRYDYGPPPSGPYVGYPPGYLG
jgi:hypothetical protein